MCISRDTRASCFLFAGSLVARLSAPVHAQCPSELLTATDAAAGDFYGIVVEVENGRAIVGALFAQGQNPTQHDAGAVYVYEADATGWAQTAKLVADDGDNADFFAAAIALDGDRIAVGAPRDSDLHTEAGAVYIFARDGIGWAQEAKLIASDHVAGQRRFGEGVSLDGNRLLVGATSYDGATDETGAAYVYELIAGTWTETAKLFAAEGATMDLFGYAVSLEGDRALVGGYRHDFPDSSAGAAWIFEFDGTSWSEIARLTGSDTAGVDNLGFEVALDGGRALVGAPNHDAGAPNTGAAYIFEQIGGSWTQSAKLVASPPVSGSSFGTDVALNGHRAVIGSPFGFPNPSGQGSAYLFEHDGLDWSQVERWEAPGGRVGDAFGYAVDTFGFTTIVGAFELNVAENGRDSGAAYVFECEQPECFLVLGSSTGVTAFDPGIHTFWPQVDEVMTYYPVLMDDIPSFPLISPPRGPSSPFGGTTLINLFPDLHGLQEFHVQVLMWNPQVFPQNPEQWTQGMRVVVLPSGRLLTSYWGDSNGGLTIWAEAYRNEQGQSMLRFPFQIPGL